MENKSIEKEIANRMYDMDERAYKSLHSTLGRVFTEEKEICIKQTVHNIKHRKIHIVRSEMALIVNMIHTVKDEQLQKELLQEYAETKTMLNELPKEMNPVDILDSDLADLKKFKQDGKQNLIICIGRQFGSAGTEIGYELANRLDIEFYDKEIFQMVLDRLDVENEAVGETPTDEVNKPKKSFFRDLTRYHGLSRQDAFFFNQSDLIKNMAKEQSFVIVGRCADVILTQNMIPHYSIFIEAPFQLRVKRTMEMKKLSYNEAVHFVKTMDRYHRKYYNFYTGKKWGDATNYDLCINSATYGIEGTIDIIEKMISNN